jgi:hypothetical protein
MLGRIVETSALDILVLIAFGLLIVLTGGVGYLTAMEWRDRRRRQQDQRGQK